MNKKIYKILLLVIIAICSNTQTEAQFNNLLKVFLSEEQRFIKAAIDSTIFIVRQDYVLRDMSKTPPVEYGRAGMDFFGRTYGLGIIANNRLWVPISTSTPWLADENFLNYSQADSLRPFLTTVNTRSLFSSEYENWNIEPKLSESKYDSILNSSYIYSYNLPEKHKSLNIKNNSIDSGWVLLAYCPRKFADYDTSEIEFAIYKTNPIFNPATNTAILKKVPDLENIIGGLFFNVNISVGKIEILLAGIIYQEDSVWTISNIPVEPVDITLTPRKKTSTTNEANGNQNVNNQDVNNQNSNNQDVNNQNSNTQDVNNQNTNTQDINNQNVNNQKNQTERIKAPNNQQPNNQNDTIPSYKIFSITN